MRLGYVLITPTWGMHQYTADLANRMAASGHEVHLVTTCQAPRDRYSPRVSIHTPVSITNTGFSPGGLTVWRLQPVLDSIRAIKPDLVHLTGPHLWNPLLLSALRQMGIPSVHTIHDLHPHAGAVYGRLLYLWNAWVRRSADHLLVHGRRFRDELIALGATPARVTHTPLTHLFVSFERERLLREGGLPLSYEPWALFLGRLEIYKGLNVLVEAVRQAGPSEGGPVRVTIAGPGTLTGLIKEPLPANVDVRAELIGDSVATDLIGRCGLVTLPYIEASQSALVAAAYFFRKPVIVTAVGALPEYVVDGETGWVIPPGDAQKLSTAISNALADPGRLARMGAAGRAAYEEWRRAEEADLRRMYTTLHSAQRALP